MSDNHDSCIIDEIEKLMNWGFCCYLEYEITGQKFPYGTFVDIYAKRKKEEIIIEVGTWSHSFEEYKTIKPKAKIIWVHQWKNYGINDWVLFIIPKIKRRLEAEQKYILSRSPFDGIELLKEPLRTKLFLEIQKKEIAKKSAEAKLGEA